jgi:hypothetical protein
MAPRVVFAGPVTIPAVIAPRLVIVVAPRAANRLPRAHFLCGPEPMDLDHDEILRPSTRVSKPVSSAESDPRADNYSHREQRRLQLLLQLLLSLLLQLLRLIIQL